MKSCISFTAYPLVVLIFLTLGAPRLAKSDVKTVFTPEFRLGAMAKFMSHLRAQRELPLLRGHDVYQPETLSDVQASVRDTFLVLERKAFGRNGILKLKACDGCIAFSSIMQSTIAIDPEFVKRVELSEEYKDSKSFIAFVLAHELAHFIYEYSLLSTGTHQSFSGNDSLIRDLEGTSEAQQAVRARAAHLEVDAFAFLLLKKSGLPYPEDSEIYFGQDSEDQGRLANLRSLGRQIFGWNGPHGQ